MSIKATPAPAIAASSACARVSTVSHLMRRLASAGSCCCQFDQSMNRDRAWISGTPCQPWTMAIENFRQLAAYNGWANLRLYGAALELPEEAYRRPTGVFFGSLHGTLNHLLVADRVWLKRLTGTGEHPDRLDA